MQGNNQRYWGSINLDQIKAAITGGVTPFKGAKGSYLDISVWVNETPDQFGNSLSIQVYNKDTKETTYLGNLKLADAPGAPVAAVSAADDLPF